MIETIHKMEPAYTVIHKLGGRSKLARALKLNKSTLTRWCAPFPGTGGAIPQKYWGELLKLAKRQGVELSPADLFKLHG